MADHSVDAGWRMQRWKAAALASVLCSSSRSSIWMCRRAPASATAGPALGPCAAAAPWTPALPVWPSVSPLPAPRLSQIPPTSQRP